MNTEAEIPYNQWNTVPRPTNGLFEPNIRANAVVTLAMLHTYSMGFFTKLMDSLFAPYS